MIVASRVLRAQGSCIASVPRVQGHVQPRADTRSLYRHSVRRDRDRRRISVARPSRQGVEEGAPANGEAARSHREKEAGQQGLHRRLHVPSHLSVLRHRHGT